MPLDRPASDLSWKISHGVLYNSEHLSSFGYALNTACFCSSPTESLEHLFFHCPLATSGIDWLQSLLFHAVPDAPPLSVRHLLFGFSPNELVAIPHIFVCLLQVLKFCVWHQRNDFRFRSVRPSAPGLFASIKSRVRFHLPLYYKRFTSAPRGRYFTRQRCASGVVCSVNNVSFIFYF